MRLGEGKSGWEERRRKERQREVEGESLKEV